MSVSFSQSVYIINENDGLVQAKLFLNNSVATDITVQVRANDSTATGEYTKSTILLLASNDITGGGVDYNSGPYNVTFPAGVTSVSLYVAINNDNILEGNETFMFIIANSSLSNQSFIITTGDHDKATVIIIDTTGK